MEDFSKSGKAPIDLTGDADEQASTGNAGGQATKPQGATGEARAGDQISDEELGARLLMFKCLESMSKDQSILEDGYYKCVEVVRGVMKEVSADLDDLENAYVAAVMKALAKWQESGAEALQAMHTANAKEWDKLHSQLIKATVEFRNACLEAETSETEGLSEVSRNIASGARKDPAVEILDLASKRTRKVVDDAAEEYLEALKDSWLGRVTSAQLPTLVASTSGVLMTFRTAVWHLISDESMWPSRLRSAGFCKMAPIVRQSLATIPALCGLVVPPRPAKAPVPPPLPVQSFLMRQTPAASSPQASISGYGSGGSTPAGTPTGAKRPFGALPRPESSPMGPPATTQPLPRRSQTPGAALTTTTPSQRPGLFSIMPSLKSGTPQSTASGGAGRGISSAAAAGLTVAVAGVSTPSSGRSFFATNPFSTRPAGHSQTSGARKGQ